MPVSQDAVKWAFRLFLGRDISKLENEEEVFNNFCNIKDEDALAEAFIKCKEMRTKNRFSRYIDYLDPKESERRQSNVFNSKAKFKISLFGNCQINGVSKIIMASLAKVHALPFRERIEYNQERLIAGEFSDVISNSDIIVVSNQYDHDAISTKYKDSKKRIRLVPAIAFNGFHPDNDYIKSAKGELLEGPLSHYQSVLAAWCWNHGLSEKVAISLFSHEVFEHLGYYNCMDSSKEHLLKVGKTFDYPLAEFLMKWSAEGCFMHSINHPKINVLADIAKEFLRKEGLDPLPSVESYVHDNLADGPCWPVYPEIAKRNNIQGSYYFKKPGMSEGYPSLIGLEGFISASFNEYSKYEKASLNSPRFQEEGFLTLEGLIKKRKNQRKSISRESPYKSLPDHCFWKRAVATIEPKSVDPVVVARFQVGKAELVATAGSCFAQHIAKRLSAEGFNYYVPEDGGSLSAEERTERNYGVFSCRYGNLYTTRQLVQLLDRSMGRFTPLENVWNRPDGRYVDPFRPQIEPAGFESEEAMLHSRREHLACVREMFTKLDILVFTLGLTESWESLEDGAVFPLAPGVAGGAMDPSRHRFHNLTAKEVADDLELFLLKLKGVNPKARVILTVSPVPLIATYENHHVLVANTHSKSVLRTVAGEMASRYSQCDYFPSYEIITGQHVGNGYLEEDLRSVRSEGVDHVMRVFLKHYAGKADTASKTYNKRETEQRAAIERINDIICDEEAIEKNS